ncbi:hypothetical protein GCM10010218_38670 [Streptomyces mashuensis]|uniref:Uncharacterized protein n=1 Tax=Streptomyces mashuensis TaxID=33904 RepID=A0A919B4H8_9ACTN|nr:hypothetical protein GCM10010218_38670 [Streptomyces mashuensis]
MLDPPRGVSPVRLGMTFDEAVDAVTRAFGRPRAREGLISVSLDHVGFQVLLEKRNRVTALELWWPGEGRTSSTRVLLDGDDVFTTPARTLMRRAAARGWTVDDADPEQVCMPGVSLGFTRSTSQEVPRERGGLPVCFTSVLVADEHYYDFLYKDRDPVRDR